MGNNSTKSRWWEKGAKVPPLQAQQTFVENFESLPRSIQKMVKDVDPVLANENFELFLKCVRFVTRKRIKQKECAHKLLRLARQPNAQETDLTPSMSSCDGSSMSTENDFADVSVEASLSEEEGEGEVAAAKKGAASPQLVSRTQGKAKAEDLVLATKRPNISLEKVAGKGGFGRVFVGKSKTSADKLAVKVLSHKTPQEVQFNLDEMYYMKHYQHANVVRYMGGYQIKHKAWLVMEYLEGGTLSETITFHQCALTEPEIAYVCKEMLTGLAFLHSKGVIHRDMKSANVMLTCDAQVKLIDFGLACNSACAGTTMCGSPFWLPPEMVHRKRQTDAVDIFSTGVCVLEMAHRRAATLGSPIAAIFYRALGRMPALEGDWSDTFRDFTALMLQFDPHERPTAEQLLQHPFIPTAVGRHHMAGILSNFFSAEVVDSSTIL